MVKMTFFWLLLMTTIAQSLTVIGQSKMDYLTQNRFDLRDSKLAFPQQEFKIIGFGAYHGSAKTEEVELSLLQSFEESGIHIDYYIMETDYSTAAYFNEYLISGDTVLLANLVKTYGNYVHQDASIATYKKWQALKALNDARPENRKLKVVGIDAINHYKYTLKQVIQNLAKLELKLPIAEKIAQQLTLDTMNYNIEHCRSLLNILVKEHEVQKWQGSNQELQHLMDNIKTSLGDYDREQVIFENYVAMGAWYDFANKPQFVRYGFFHLEKQRESPNYPPFFARLIDNKVYERDEIISVIGYLTKSKVLWGVRYDEEGNYQDAVSFGGFGIGDYWKEYFRGIKKLKKTSLSDLTLYRLNASGTPYAAKIPDLMHIRMLWSKSNKVETKGKSTTEFLDYAVLIRNSPASKPIQILNQ